MEHSIILQGIELVAPHEINVVIQVTVSGMEVVVDHRNIDACASRRLPDACNINVVSGTGAVLSSVLQVPLASAQRINILFT